ncbi:SGNH/GDSL hydrolase family protein [Xanthobacter sp. YC-JY1]|uniref:SGNH/GDSL hydrolase family protein n=1 Tax=Xanthobacter sp. YC-JY1 TaxID=2419844 RepID=UPI001F28122A|nr:SGNH/GDSL hydrolase family protein [Xanthobacter sp. YC-JY1]UJX46650.1 SGNH/GDSL hydrolase family protein [Xanthobacter sp. YC-JY1]
MSALDILALGMATDPGNIGGNWNQSTSALKNQFERALAQAQPLQARPWKAALDYTVGEAIKQGMVRNSSGKLYEALNSGTCITAPTTLVTAVESGGTLNWAYAGIALSPPADQEETPTVDLAQGSTVPSGLTAWPTYNNRARLALMGCYPTEYAGSGRLRLYSFSSNASSPMAHGSSRFFCDAPIIAAEVTSGTSGMAINVNSRPLIPGTLSPLPATNDFTKITWGSRRPRLYEIFAHRGAGNIGLLGLTAADRIWPAPPPINLRMGWIGDSYDEGSGYGPMVPGRRLCQLVGRRLGIYDVWSWSKGGTGLINQGVGSAFYTYIQRIPEIAARSPHLWIIQGSTNDSGYSAAQIKAAAKALIAAIRAVSSAPIVWVGPVYLASVANIATIDDAISDGVAEMAAGGTANVWYYSMYDDLVWDANNLSLQVAGDAVHAFAASHDNLAERISAYIINTVYPGIQ